MKWPIIEIAVKNLPYFWQWVHSEQFFHPKKFWFILSDIHWIKNQEAGNENYVGHFIQQNVLLFLKSVRKSKEKWQLFLKLHLSLFIISYCMICTKQKKFWSSLIDQIFCRRRRNWVIFIQGVLYGWVIFDLWIFCCCCRVAEEKKEHFSKNTSRKISDRTSTIVAHY